MELYTQKTEHFLISLSLRLRNRAARKKILFGEDDCGKKQKLVWKDSGDKETSWNPV